MAFSLVASPPRRHSATPGIARIHASQIFGLLEARLMRADVMLLGGLDDGDLAPTSHERRRS